MALRRLEPLPIPKAVFPAIPIKGNSDFDVEKVRS
jgi:hypothetical protein